MSVRTIAVLSAACASVGASAQALTGSFFYGGDPNGINALTSEYETEVTDSFVFDDFGVSAKASVKSVYGRFVSNIDNPRGFDWAILKGTTAGNQGTVVQSGLAAPGTWTKDGRTLNGFTGRLVQITVDFDLDPGVYFVGIRVRSEMSESGRAFVQQTNGDGSVGSPVNNDNSFVDSSFYGWNYLPVHDYTGESTDFSYGLTVVPEPGTLTAFAVAGLAAWLRRRSETRRA